MRNEHGSTRWVVAVILGLTAMAAVVMRFTLAPRGAGVERAATEVRQSWTSVPVAAPVAATPSAEEPPACTGARVTTRAGFSFVCPTGAAVVEDESSAGVDEGAMRSVMLLPVARDGAGVIARAQSVDYALGVGEGAGFVLQGKVDLSKSDATVRAALQPSLGEVFALRRVTVAGRPAVRFYNVASFAGDALRENVLVATGDAAFPVLHVAADTGVRWLPDGAAMPALDDRAVAALLAASDAHPTRAADLHDFLASLRWEPMTAQ